MAQNGAMKPPGGEILRRGVTNAVPNAPMRQLDRVMSFSSRVKQTVTHLPKVEYLN